MKCKTCGHELEESFLLGKKEFKFIDWDKPVKDYKIPKGWRIAEYFEFVELYDSGIDLGRPWKFTYFAKNYSKRNIKEGWVLSKLYLDANLSLDSRDVDLTCSSGNGRIVIVRDLE